ncbi:Golgi CORVET complex core vacuolar protein 8-domain-containing protein [Melanogaster broomeanus]|nr:Golgi CORVET complex core vacuolar protein 8-domain-containing protein [Melanogaster broomeanus]
MVEEHGIADSSIRSPSPSISSHDEDVDEDHQGDYSKRMEELFDGDEEHEAEGDEEEGFIYDGVDAEQITGNNYREQLRDVLGPDDTSDIFEEDDVEHSLIQEALVDESGDVNGSEPLLYAQRPSKAALLLGASNLGSPMVFAANGLICVGTDAGRIFVFDFKQTLLCICGTIALSHDHTYVASGHVSGHIQLFDLKTPQVPARLVAPPSTQALLSGRQEGHPAGSRITSVSFVAGRHTAIVSADENGLSFYHSLGKVLFVDASDTVRILGNYPEKPVADPDGPHVSASALNGSGIRSFRKRRLRNTMLAMSTLPLGTATHRTDAYQIVAMLTPTKLVIVGLKPSPKTWLKRTRDDGTESVPKETVTDSTDPTLAYSWGKTVRLMRTREVDMGTLVFEDAGNWAMEDAVLALQWINANQLSVFTATTLSVCDTRTCKVVEHVHFDASALASPSLSSTTNGSVPYSESLYDITHSIRAYKGKIFLLGREGLQVGTLLTWADKILSLVEQGDFLSAIELTRSYYTGDAPGNRNGLPDEKEEQKVVLGQKLHELMVASTRYAFSEDRMTDGTHSSADGRGVDRTSVFESLVTTCARACITLDNYDFLFEDLFQHFEDTGILRIYLEQLETFVLEGIIHFVPPRITQRLVALHDDNGQPDLVERVIWHIDPSCLDINQAIHLCQTYQLWDALIYVYTRALQDYVSPIVELIPFIRKTLLPAGDMSLAAPHHAYKIFPGQTYPSGEPLPSDEAQRAMKDVYQFIFRGRLILTGQDNGVEPTYPYARLLLHFDAESFLHSMDIAFEDSLSIVKILWDIGSHGDLPLSAMTFINIFIARNVPKYPQYLQKYLHVEPSILHDVLISLATPLDCETREDRQLAAEYLFSHVFKLFEDAGFYRILQNRHRHERQWTQLFLQTADVLPYNDNALPEDMVNALSDALAALVDKFAPSLHEAALDAMGPTDDRQRYDYLLHLLDPQSSEGEDIASSHPPDYPHVSELLCQRFIKLQCRYSPSGVIDTLNRMRSSIEWPTVEQICEENHVYGTVLWALNQRGRPREALAKAEAFGKQLTQHIARAVMGSSPDELDVNKSISALREIGQRGASICLEHSSTSATTEVPLEDIWFQLLSCQLHSVQIVSNLRLADDADGHRLKSIALSTLRGLVQDTFASLVTISSTRAVSFPRLFKRLVDPGLYAASTSRTPYTEFRTILTGMLESYRSDGDMLFISQRLLDRDVFDTMQEFTKEKMKGWSAQGGVCSYCHQALLQRDGSSTIHHTDIRIIVSRTAIYHSSCPP